MASNHLTSSSDKYARSVHRSETDGGVLPQPPVHHPVVRWLKRLGYALLVALLVALLAAGAWTYTVLRGVSSQPLDSGVVSADSSGRTNVLLLGVGDPGHSGEKLSDSIMVLSFNARTKQVASISLPRDLRVEVPGFGERKINNANALGGSTLAAQTVSNVLNIPIDYTLTTNFTGLSKLTDAVGGVDVNVKEELKDPEYPCADNQYKSCGVDIKPGQQHMDGARVLEYTRCRKGTCGNDFGRAARQQEVIGLIVKKLMQPTTWLNPWAMWQVKTALHDGLQTTMSAPTMIRLAWRWTHRQGDIISWVLSTGKNGMLVNGGGSDLVPIGDDFSAIADQAQHIFSKPPQQEDTR